MSVYVIADLHGDYLPPPPADCDLLLIAGDICPDFVTSKHIRGTGGHQQANWLDTTFRKWLESYGGKTIAIWGNHDFVGEHPRLVPSLPWTLLQDSEVTVDGLRIYGTPWVPGLPRWAFFQNPSGLAARAESIPEGLDVLMTHGPPKGNGDFIPTSPKQRDKYDNRNGEHVGDSFLGKAIDRARPGVTVCGHIHEARGRYKTPAGMTVLNVAAVDEAYVPYDTPFVKIT